MKKPYLVLLALLFATPLFAQTVKFSGKALDSSGAVVPNADVEVVNLETNVKRTVQSGASGNYTVPLLGPGLYRRRVTNASPALASLLSFRAAICVLIAARRSTGSAISTGRLATRADTRFS